MRNPLRSPVLPRMLVRPPRTAEDVPRLISGHGRAPILRRQHAVDPDTAGASRHPSMQPVQGLKAGACTLAVEKRTSAVGTAGVGLPSARARAVVAVPRDALVLRRDGDFVIRVDAAGRAERLPAHTGEALAGLVEIAGAVAPATGWKCAAPSGGSPARPCGASAAWTRWWCAGAARIRSGSPATTACGRRDTASRRGRSADHHRTPAAGNGGRPPTMAGRAHVRSRSTPGCLRHSR